MKVTLAGMTGSPVKVCAAAAWVCTHEKPKNPDDFSLQQAGDLCARVIAMGHYGIAEHASFTFCIEGISLVCSHQLVRHRLASYCQRSLRYNQLSGDSQQEYYATPSSISDTSCEGKFENVGGIYANSERTALSTYQQLLRCNVPQEDARYCLPTSTLTNILMTMNARAWRDFLQQRMCLKAQAEIGELANAIYKILIEQAPPLFQGKFPNCGQKGECKGCKGVA